MHSGKAAKVVRYQIIMKNTAEQDKRMSRIYGHDFYFAHDESLIKALFSFPSSDIQKMNPTMSLSHQVV